LSDKYGLNYKFKLLKESKDFNFSDNAMFKPEYLDVNQIVRDKSILKLFRAVAAHGGVLRFVGGAVRDVLAGKKGFEIDLATDLSPEELIEACEESGLKTTSLGLKSATTGVVINNDIVEVSSLVKSGRSDKSASDLDFTDDWNADASKRDLTINAVYADEHGNVFDYYNGIDDLEHGLIRFIGAAEERIKENPIRIMRFFRFYSIFGKGLPDLKSLKACVENRDLLKNIAIEQVRDELFKIFLTPNVLNTLQIIFENDILSYILPVSTHRQEMENLGSLVAKNNLKPDALRRLFILYLPDPALAESLAVRLHLSKKQKTRLTDWAKYAFDAKKIKDPNYLRQICYQHDKEFCKDKILFSFAIAGKCQENLTDIFAQIDRLVIPEFPLNGKDLIRLGLSDYSKISDILEQLKDCWIERDFQLSAEQLQHIAYELVCARKI